MHVHGEYYHAHTPAIDHLVIAFVVRLVDHLWREIYRCPAHRLDVVRQPTRPKYSRSESTYPEHRHAVDDLRETEICDLDDGRLVVGQEYVLRLQVTVRDALTMHILWRVDVNTRM